MGSKEGSQPPGSGQPPASRRGKDRLPLKCAHCGVTKECYGKKYCSNECSQAARNLAHPNPAPISAGSGEHLQLIKLKKENTSLKSDLRALEKRALTSDSLRSMIHDINQADLEIVPEWLFSKSKSHVEGIPVLTISDVHFDEYVDPSQIEYVNSYNREIAENRIKWTFQKTIDILSGYSSAKYDGFVCCLGGDMVSGNIHEELMETNEFPILNTVIRLSELLISGLEELANKFKKLYVPCVVGNHGRLFKKPKAKNRVFDNYEWLIYQIIAKHFKNDKRVTVHIPDGPDCRFTIYQTNFLLTHGDQFRGGSGISGIFTPLMLGMMRKQKKLAAVNKSFEVMICGHFHSYIHTNSLIVNGSIKGYDEWTSLMNFTYERPQQALFIQHPEHGMVFRTPIICDSYPGGRDYEKE